MKFICIYVYLIFLLFGPKIYGYIDTSILANVAALCFLNGHKLKMKIFVPLLAMWIVFIILCYMGVAIYYESVDIVFVGRFIRSLCSFLCIYAFCTYYTEFSIERKLDWLINVLLIHAIIVLLSATLFVNLQEHLRVITDFAAHSRKYRSTGLMAGYDMSGLICNIGVMLVLVKKKFNVVKFFIFSSAVLLTSRLSMISLSLILLLYFIFFRKEDGFFKSVCIAMPLFVAGGIGFILLSLTTSGFLPEEIVPSIKLPSRMFDTLIWTYAKSDMEQTSVRYFFFPETFFSFIFGVGSYIGSDPGYVRMINCVGLFGLTSIILWHVYLFYNFFTAKQCDKRETTKRNFLGISFALILIFLNLKNSYFYTGTFFEIMMFVLFCYIAESYKRFPSFEVK